MPDEQLYIAATTFVTTQDGRYRWFHKNKTIVRSDDPVYQRRPGAFKPVAPMRIAPPSYSPPVEQATAAPGEKRAARGRRTAVVEPEPEPEAEPPVEQATAAPGELRD
jgi:hypothetical protein